MINQRDRGKKLAVWAVTPKGADLGARLAGTLENADLHLSAGLENTDGSTWTFDRLSTHLADYFHQYDGHLFIMSSGIVVRLIAPLIKSKWTDPAVVVMDERGDHAVSLLSGHIGGANKLAKKTARLIGGKPVITTATDVNNLLSIDLLALEKDLFMENPQAVKTVNTALLTGRKIGLHDPYGFLTDTLSLLKGSSLFDRENNRFDSDRPGIYIDDQKISLRPHILILRPKTLIAGIGCNRHSGLNEIKRFLEEVLERRSLAPACLAGIASIDLKKDEPGLTALAEELGLPLRFYHKDALNRVNHIQTPSDMVEKHTGVKSVCEAAAILAAGQGKLIVPKQSTDNVTVAIARIVSI